MLTVFLLAFAAMCFLLAAFNVPLGKVNLVALGLLAFVLVPLIAALT